MKKVLLVTVALIGLTASARAEDFSGDGSNWGPAKTKRWCISLMTSGESIPRVCYGYLVKGYDYSLAPHNKFGRQKTQSRCEAIGGTWYVPADSPAYCSH